MKILFQQHAHAIGKNNRRQQHYKAVGKEGPSPTA
jgi:hypothetical protein